MPPGPLIAVLTIMDFHNYTTLRDRTRLSTPSDRFANDLDHFYKEAMPCRR